MCLFFTVKNPSTNTLPIDVSVSLNVIKCHYPNCEYPVSPGLQLPATSRPSDALYWSNDSDWSFALEGYGGYGKYHLFYFIFLKFFLSFNEQEV
jgi:hypothetical protein